LEPQRKQGLTTSLSTGISTTLQATCPGLAAALELHQALSTSPRDLDMTASGLYE